MAVRRRTFTSSALSAYITNNFQKASLENISYKSILNQLQKGSSPPMLEVYQLINFIQENYGETTYSIFDWRKFNNMPFAEPLQKSLLTSHYSKRYEYTHNKVVAHAHNALDRTLVIYIEVESCGNTQDRISTI